MVKAKTLAHLPRQARSVRTEARILAATEALLAERSIDQLTIEDIAGRAHVSVGAFYKRFRGKSSLLPLVLERVQTQQIRRLREFLALPRWRDASLDQCVHAVLQVFGQAQLERRALYRRLLVNAWADAPAAGVEDSRSRELMQCLVDWLAQRQEQIGHPQPLTAIRIGLAASLHTLQAAVLMQRLPEGLPLETLSSELARMVCRYLEVDQAGSGEAS